MSAGFLAKCARKRRHLTQASAEGQRESLISQGKWTRAASNTYRCNACGGFHAGRIGSPNRGKSRKISTRPIYHTQ